MESVKKFFNVFSCRCNEKMNEINRTKNKQLISDQNIKIITVAGLGFSFREVLKENLSIQLYPWINENNNLYFLVYPISFCMFAPSFANHQNVTSKIYKLFFKITSYTKLKKNFVSKYIAIVVYPFYQCFRFRQTQPTIFIFSLW